MNAFYCCLALGLAPPEPGALLLDDLSLVEGTVEPFGDLLRVTAADGKSKLVPVRQVIHRGAGRADVYKFLTAKTDPDSAAARAQLANWFLQVNDPERAVVEARAAARLAPTVSAFGELVKRCESAAVAKKPTVVQASATSAGTSPAARPVVPSDVQMAFGTRVQPLLTNQCSKCHAAKAYTGSFKLERVTEGYANAPGVAANLAAATAQLTAADPANSPLVVYATTPHGGMTTPLPRTHPAMQTLTAWALAIAPTNERRGLSPPKELPPAVVQAKAEVIPPAPPVKVEEKAPAGTSPAARPPGIPINPADPFDPAGFNKK